MPHDTDLAPREGWAFWAAVAVVAGILTGAALVRGSWWIVVLGVFAIVGATAQMVGDIHTDRTQAARAAARRERLR